MKTNITIAIGSDHKGYELKKEIINYLNQNDIKTIDYGTYDVNSVDYPDYGIKVSDSVANKESNYGILVCYTGIGMSIVANKVKGIRAALVNSVENTILTRNHNDANVLCLSAKDVNKDLALKIVNTFLSEDYEGGRHQNRLDKIKQIEDRY